MSRGRFATEAKSLCAARVLRWTACALLACGCLLGQSTGTSSDKNAAPDSDEVGNPALGLPPPPKAAMPPEEDKTDAPEVYSFNPVQSQHEVAAGDFYFKKGNYTAAVSRYDEATKWNDGNAEAWLRLGEAEEKSSNAKAAKVAYQKYLALSPDAKNAREIKKKLTKLKG